MDFYNQVGWLLVALAAIDTGGGANVQGNVRTRGDFIGRDHVNIYADQDVWRTGVARDLTELREENRNLRAQLMATMILIAVLFLVGFMATALAIRQFDRQWTYIDNLEHEMQQLFYVRPSRIP